MGGPAVGLDSCEGPKVVQSQAEQANNSVLGRIVGEANECQAYVNNVECRGLLDTGSMVTTIGEMFYREHLNNSALQPLGNLLRVEGASGQAIPYLGYIEMDIKFPKEVTGEEEVHSILALVVPQTEYNQRVPLVIGTNIIRLCKDKCTKRCGVRFLQKMDVPSPWRLAYKYLTVTSQQHQLIPGPVQVKTGKHHATVVKPNETTIVEGYVRTAHNPLAYSALIEPVSESAIASTVIIAPAVVQVEPKGSVCKIPIQVYNISTREVVIPPRAVICELHEVSWALPPAEADKVGITTYCESNIVQPGDGNSEDDEGTGNPYEVDLSQSNLTPDQLVKARAFLDKWKCVFSQHEFDFGRTSAVEHRIPLTDEKPFKLRHHRIPPGMYEELRQHLQKLLECGAIRASHSPYSSPIVIVRKRQTNQIRMCLDFRELNKRTVKDSYALPRIEECFHALANCNMYSCLDATKGYLQIPIAEEHKARTAFTAGPLGHWECNSMWYGLTSAPATFQRMMENCLGDLNLTQCVAFLDDIVAFSVGFENHLQRLEAIFTRLKEYGIKLQPSKCKLFRERVQYLGHVVSKDGIETDPDKIEALKTWPVPKNVKELRTFLGFAGYYRRFVKDFAKIAKPLHDLTAGLPCKKRKGHKATPLPEWKWEERQQKAFEELIAKLTSPPILAYADYSKPYILHTDASTEGLGAVLYQEHEGKERVIAYASRGLNKSERNYPAHKLEFLALKWAVTSKFHDYLYASQTPFKVRTDNNPLTYVLTTAKLDATGHRWLAALGAYDFKIEYRPGAKSTDCDGLSRRPHIDNTIGRETEVSTRITGIKEISQEAIQAICSYHCATEGSQEPNFDPLIETLPINLSSKPDVTAQQFVQLGQETLPSMSMSQWKIAQEEDPVVGRVLQYWRQGSPPSKQDRLTENSQVLLILREWHRLCDRNGVLHRKCYVNGGLRYQLVLPGSYHAKVLTELHDKMGHVGIERTLDLLRCRFYYPKMAEDVAKKVRHCDRCTRRKVPLSAHKTAPLVSIHSTYPMELVCIDFLSLEESKGGYSSILVITDHFTRFAQAIPCRNQTAKTTARALFDNFIVHYGFPTRIHSDQGANFESALIKDLCELGGTIKTHTSPYHAMGNGATERFNRTLLDMLGTLPEEKKADWKSYVAPLVHGYNCTRHESTQHAPFYLLFGRHPKLPIDIYLGIQPENSEVNDKDEYIQKLREGLRNAHELASAAARKAKAKQKKYYDRKAGSAELELGDRVLVKNVKLRGKHKIADRWEKSPHVVLSQPNKDIPVYVIQQESGHGPKRTLHRNLLLPYFALPCPDQCAPRNSRPKPTSRHRYTGKDQTEESSSSSEEGSDEDDRLFPVRITRSSGSSLPPRPIAVQVEPQLPDHTDAEDVSVEVDTTTVMPPEDNQIVEEESDSGGEDSDGPRRSDRNRTQPKWMKSGDWKIQQQSHIPVWVDKANFLASMREKFPDDSSVLCSAIVNIVNTG